MSERTLAEPLSGAEIVDRILEEVRRRLRQDCYLNPVFAYSSFSCRGHLVIELHDSGATPQVITQFQAASENPLDEDAYLAEADLHIGEAPPNTVREEAHIGIPTEVRNADGQVEIKRQIYGQKSRGRQMAGVPEQPLGEGGDVR